MQASSTSESTEAKPYGLIGLVVATTAIGLLAMALCAIAAGLVLGAAVALRGLNQALETVSGALVILGNAQRPGAKAEDIAFLVKVGLVVSLVVYAAVVVSTMIVARFRAGPRWLDILALQPWHPFRGTRIFWAVAAIAFGYNIGASTLIAWIYPASKDWIVAPTQPVWIFGFVVLAVVFAPICEEMVFRGWLFTSLRRSIGVTATIIITSVLFALAHWESTHLYALAVLPVGLALGIIREKTGTIAASMTFHAAYNGAACVLLVSGF